MLNSNPQIAEIQALDGRAASTLSTMETAVLNFYHANGRKHGVSVTIINRAKVRATYNKALLLDQRRTLLQDWADYLSAVEGIGAA